MTKRQKTYRGEKTESITNSGGKTRCARVEELSWTHIYHPAQNLNPNGPRPQFET